jgi:hypothetical protein
MVSEGGKKAKAANLQLGQWEVTLYNSPDDFFHAVPYPSINGKCPVLMLLNRK